MIAGGESDAVIMGTGKNIFGTHTCTYLGMFAASLPSFHGKWISTIAALA